MLERIRPSRLVAIAIIIAVPTLIMHLRSVVYAGINAPSYVGFYERRADIRYGDLPRQSLDVYRPGREALAKRPIVVFWYGGSWMKGSKDQFRFVGAALASAGYVAVLPDYRLFPQVRFPRFIEDGALAVKWVREHASELGGDPDAIFLMGHSAGGHLAATLALDEHYFRNLGGDSRWIRGWIALSAPYELKRMHMGMYLLLRANESTAWRPITLASNRAPPALLVHGMDDASVDPQEVRDMQALLRAAGTPAKCRIYNVGHVGTALALSLPFRFEANTLADVREFIDQTMRGDFSNDECPRVFGQRHGNWEHPPARPDLLVVP